MKTILIKIFKIKCPQSNQKTMLLLKRSFLSILEKPAPLKKKLLRANHAPYVTKALRKAVMTRSHLEKLYFKNRTPSS